ncbi:flavin-dependent dehydrogenase [Frankia casuarinae]|uniref:Monooxygenase, FAD-binding n=1 Tax=Frankia casuarinae (strain DSM 45818 / CECT 9043 / HFP020203 / CcI3) TaxID=106370 RepID=Q2JAN0_FRACC|nr:NAD(P)/FAD-dependent oxidoreductase [Frankia casuarinae]ABD11662.1 monooxygenase, FAD-binding [Frankia casuarinae]EYT89986.1 flavin-dependent dehydrogenase [Frankia casuarinae]
MYDAIVVGARCAGSPLAMLLARRGHRVLLVDRATFPADTLSTHYLPQAGAHQPAGWGLLDRLVRTGCPPITEMTLSWEDSVITGGVDPVDGISAAYAPRRTVLDAMLLDAALDAGVEVRLGYPVTDVLVADGRAVGIRGGTRRSGGAAAEDRAAIVIGADGPRSTIAATMNAAFYNVVPAASFIYYSYWSGLDRQHSARFRNGAQIGCWPTNDGLTVVAVMRRRERLAEFRADVPGNFLGVVRAVFPELADELATRGRREERFHGSLYPDNYYRAGHGPGWALVGDAGYHRDPVTAQGMLDAFTQADLLAAAVDRGLSGQQPMNAALADFQRHRDEATAASYRLACTVGELAFPPELAALLVAAANSPETRKKFLGMVAGFVPLAEFFAPAHLTEPKCSPTNPDPEP